MSTSHLTSEIPFAQHICKCHATVVLLVVGALHTGVAREHDHSLFSEPTVRTINRIAMSTPFLVFAVMSASTLAAQATVVSEPTKPHVLKPSADLITQEQLTSRTFSNAYAAIEALHSNWLRARNLNPESGAVINPQTSSSGSGGAGGSPTTQAMPREASGIKVYIDGVRAGGIDVLKTIPIATVYSMRRINGTAAQARFGIGHSDGVIFVATGPDKGGSS